MTSLSSFMSIAAGSSEAMSVTPLWVNNGHKNPAVFKEWFTKHLLIVESYNQYRIWNEWNNLLWYTGDILSIAESRPMSLSYPNVANQARKTFPFWVSHVSDLVDKRSNDLSSLKPNFEVLPTNAEEGDRMASRIMRPILKHLREFNNLDMKFDDNEKTNTTFGISFMGIEINESIGDLKPREKEKDPYVWEGEVEIKELVTWHVLSFPARKAFTSPMAFQIYEILHVEEARRKYGVKDLEQDNRTSLFHFASPFEADLLPEEVVIYRVVHIPNQYLPEGAVIYCTKDGRILKSQVDKYPWSHKGFPWEMHTDITIQGRMFPYSIMNYLKPLQWTYNLLGGMIKKSIFLCAHPKWMMPRGACNIQSLANAITVVQHKVGQKPELASYNTVPNEVFTFRDSVRTEMRQLAGSSPLSSGEVPPNTRSGIQISRLMSIEKMNRSYQMGKRNNFMKRVLLKAASVAGDYYPTMSPEHIVRIVGKELAGDVKILAETKVYDRYAITIQNAGGFSDDLAGRLEEVAFANEKLPGLLTPQQQADIIGLRSQEKFYDITTGALRMAEAENEKMNNGETCAPPLMEHDHIQHWITHVIDMQTPQHRQLPDKLRRKKEEHLGIHEMMMERISKSPTGQVFAQKLQALERFPLVYKPNKDEAAIQAEMQQAQPTPALPNQNGAQQ